MDNSRLWLESRHPAPPERLMSRIEAALCEYGASSDSSLSEAFVGAARKILQQLTTSGGAVNRVTAIDLLAADALITYALEAAAEDCGSFAVKSDEAIASLSEIGSA